MPQSTLILYNAGAYGTYLEWVLNTLTTNVNLVSPLTDAGSSHLSGGILLGGVGSPQWNQKLNQHKEIKLARAHPKIHAHESIQSNIDFSLKSFDKIIFCYPDQNSVLLNINNAFTKIWDDWIENRLKDSQFAEDLYTNWNIARGTPSKHIPVWIKREILSYNLMPSWQSEVEWFFPDRQKQTNCYFVFINELLYNFKHVIINIQQFCNLDFKKDINQLVLHHDKMLSLQKYLNQDTLCDNIVNSVINSQKFNWDFLPLASQSWIQWQLRNLGYEIRCDGLDIFPTNSVKLQELIYKV